jgi:hypothetical protein
MDVSLTGPYFRIKEGQVRLLFQSSNSIEYSVLFQTWPRCRGVVVDRTCGIFNDRARIRGTPLDWFNLSSKTAQTLAAFGSICGMQIFGKRSVPPLEFSPTVSHPLISVFSFYTCPCSSLYSQPPLDVRSVIPYNHFHPGESS